MESNAGGGRADRYNRPTGAPPVRGRSILGPGPHHPQQQQQQQQIRHDALPRNYMMRPRLRSTQPQQGQHQPVLPGGQHRNSNLAAGGASPQGQRVSTVNSSPGGQQQGYRNSNPAASSQGQRVPTVLSQGVQQQNQGHQLSYAAVVGVSPQGQRGLTVKSSPTASAPGTQNQQAVNTAPRAPAPGPQQQNQKTVNSSQIAPAPGPHQQNQKTVNSLQTAPAPGPQQQNQKTVDSSQRTPAPGSQQQNHHPHQGLNPQHQGPLNFKIALLAPGGQPQGYQTSKSPPATTQQQPTVDVPNAVVMELTLPPHIEKTNLQYMFDKEAQFCLKEGVIGYVQFPSEEEAEQAREKWCILEKIAQPKQKNSDSHKKTTPYGAMPIKFGTLDIKRKRNAAEDVVSGQKKNSGFPEKRQRTDVTEFRKLESKAYDWCPIAEYSKEDSSKEIVRPYKFTAAARCGSVSPLITLCSLGPIGNTIFPSVSTHLFSTHLSGRTFRGNFTTKDIAIERNLQLCAVLKRTYKLEKASEIADDISSMISSLEPLYKINGSWLPHYIGMIESLKKAPTNLDLQELSEFYSKILLEICFATLEMKRHLLGEFHANYKNLQEAELKRLDEAAPTGLEDWQHIRKADKLVGGFRVTGDNKEKFGKEAQYMRHLLEHALDLQEAEFRKDLEKQQEEELKNQEEGNASIPSAPLAAAVAAAAPAHANKALLSSSSSSPSTVAPPAPVQSLKKLVFDLLERDMLIFYYLRKFWPAFIDFMFERRSDHSWLDAMCEYYSKSIWKGVILHETIKLPEGERSEDGE